MFPLGSKNSSFLGSLVAALLLFFVTFVATHSIAHLDDAQPTHAIECGICKIISTAGGLLESPSLVLAAILLVATTAIFFAKQTPIYSKKLLTVLGSRAPPLAA